MQPRPIQACISHPRRFYLGLKRLFDLVVALIGCIVLLPMMAVIALLIVLDSPGPALFVQTRIGKGGRPFRILKFRTLRHNLDDSEHRDYMRAFVRGEVEPEPNGKTHYKPFGNSEITRVGRILRKTSLDELPQLVNILKGEMSLIGPRPNVPWEVEVYKPWHMERLAATPGLTGLAQVNGRSGIDFDTIARYDIQYVRHQSLRMDVQIAYRTFREVIGGRGAH